MKATQVMIEGRLWAIIPSPRKAMESPQHDGQCDYDNQTIQIYSRLSLHEALETVIHEVMHAQQPDIHEDAIARRAKEITRALIKTGLFKQPWRNYERTRHANQ